MHMRTHLPARLRRYDDNNDDDEDVLALLVLLVLLVILKFEILKFEI